MTKYSDMVYAKSHPSISMFSFCKCHKCVKHLNMKFVMLKLMQFILVGKAFNNNCIAKLCDGCFFCLYTHAELQQLIIATFCCLQNYFSKNGPTCPTFSCNQLYGIRWSISLAHWPYCFSDPSSYVDLSSWLLYWFVWALVRLKWSSTNNNIRLFRMEKEQCNRADTRHPFTNRHD